MAYSIEFRELNILGFGGHNYFVLRNDRGEKIGEIHGLAIDRVTQQPKEIGTNADQLQVRDYGSGQDSGYYLDGQSAREVFRGSQTDVLSKWNAAISAGKQINDNNVTYDLFGGSSGNTVIANSNSVANTLGAVMGVQTPNLSWWTINPGDGKNLLPRCKGHPLAAPSIKNKQNPTAIPVFPSCQT